MNLFEAIVLGIVQGLTEFLPISSSAHLRLTSQLLGIGDAGSSFTAITQLGTEAAVVVFFWRDILRIVKAWFGSLFGRVDRGNSDAKMGWWIILGSVPIVVCGVLFEHLIDSSLRSLWFVGAMLIIFGILLGIADRLGRSDRQLSSLTAKHGIIYGLAQALALIPGVSRSGGTITAGRLLGYSREAAARYSFLLAIPAVVGSGGYKLYKSLKEPSTVPGMQTLVATIVAFAVAIAIIKWFMSYISTRSFMPFVIYRIVLGAVILVLVATGVLQADGGITVAEQSQLTTVTHPIGAK
ncbi:undecaprenyl-diphosphate phosphatase [Leucobacter sp. OH1287]|uniref:undecaprenyl-diphosphate phosphatase n=1 Tax=Leucobacter sp. OH1287 TaxID=2491049 RepID=UPI000F5E2AE0|nr:undecaprenyl-diphosphate phosphatase [Leucobacter sp. OH1287]RRD61898.1 undecaprenyl-diphosphate phosphatase [Leucobacter sp. OH1287]